MDKQFISLSSFFFFFFNDTATTEIYTLSLHDALPISARIGPLIPSEWGGLGAGRVNGHRAPPFALVGSAGPASASSSPVPGWAPRRDGRAGRTRRGGHRRPRPPRPPDNPRRSCVRRPGSPRCAAGRPPFADPRPRHAG